MKPAPEKFEDRKGSNYELGRDRSSRPSENEMKFVDRKEEQQRKKYGVKPTDTNIDVANLVARDVLANVIKEEPSQEAQQMTKPDDDFDEEEKKKEDKIFDPKEELRIKMMQYLNPRILKSKELKDYMKRTNVNEAIGARLNDIATEKLDLYKKAIAINAPVELNERIKANKEKSKNVARQIGANAFISRKVDTMQSPLIAGREVMSNPEISSQQVSDLYNKLPNPLEKSPATMVADHQALHTLHEGVGPKIPEITIKTKRPERPLRDMKLREVPKAILKGAGNVVRGAANKIGDATLGDVVDNMILLPHRPSSYYKNLIDVYKKKKNSEKPLPPWKRPMAPMPGVQAPNEQPALMPAAPDRPRGGRGKQKSGLPVQQFAEETEQLDEAKRNPNVIKQGRTKIVKARVRGGKVQRRKKLSAVKGFTVRGGKLKRMSMAERLRRKRGQRRGKIKRKAKMARALMRRKRSMRRRASLGLKE